MKQAPKVCSRIAAMPVPQLKDGIVPLNPGRQMIEADAAKPTPRRCDARRPQPVGKEG